MILASYSLEHPALQVRRKGGRRVMVLVLLQGGARRVGYEPAGSTTLSFKLARALKGIYRTAGVASATGEFRRRFSKARRSGGAEDAAAYKKVSNLYYDLATDFYEFGWGRSFHFAPRAPGESFKASISRHEHYLAHALGLRPGMVVADLGCGVGGPLLEIVRFSGAKIVGVNINAYQLERARRHAEEADLTHLAEFLESDYLDVGAPDCSFDAAYAIESTCHAPDKVSVFSEVFRLLKPGAPFGSYEWCLTDRFDDQDARHVKAKADIEVTFGLLELDHRQAIDDALRSVGFELLDNRDLAVQAGPSVPWYQPLVGSGLSLAGFRSSRIGRRATTQSLRLLEALRITPPGALKVAKTLSANAEAVVEAGRLGMFTPMYFVHARKPA